MDFINRFVDKILNMFKEIKQTMSEELNGSINNAKDELEYCGECSIENTHWLSFHYAFLDVIKHHFELVKCKQINSYRILKVMNKDFAKFYYGGNEYKTFQEYKENNMIFIAENLLSGKENI